MTFDQSKPYTLDRIVRIGIAIAIGYGLFKTLDYLSSVLIPFVIALLIAYLMYPMVQFFEKRLFKNRIASVLVTFFLISFALVGLIIITIPLMAEQIEKMGSLITNLVNNNTGGSLPEYLASIEAYILEFVQQEEVQEALNMSNIQQVIERVLPSLVGVFSSSLNLIMGIVGLTIVIFYIIFILVDYDEITQGWQEFVPTSFRKPIVTVLEDLRDGMETYFRAQSLIVLIVSILFAIGFSIIGMPLGILLGIFIGLLNYVPYLQNIGFIPATFLVLMHSLETGEGFWVMFGLMLLVFTIVQLVQDAFLTPKIMGDATGLNPAAILLSLTVWGKLLGMLGLLIAIPITSILISYYRRFLRQTERSQSKIILEPHLVAASTNSVKEHQEHEEDIEKDNDNNSDGKIIIP